MFCSGCGSQIQPGLHYCSRCGRRVSDEGSANLHRAKPFAVAGNIAGVGFVAFIFVLLVLVRNGVPGVALVPITFFYFAALFGICMMFLRSDSSAERKDKLPADDEAEQRAFLHPVTTAQLEASREIGVGSVTDHTTRTLDEIPLKRS